MIRTIMDMYECQESRVVSNNEYGEYFTSTNGVRQGGITSPLMFTVYTDELIKELKTSGIGCHIGHEYLGCLGYADDLKLMCPGIKGLQKIISICEKFGEKYGVKYNEKNQYAYLLIGPKIEIVILMIMSNITLDESRIKWANSVKDLGNYIAHDLSESDEIRHKTADFIWRAYVILVKYQDVVPEVKIYLLNSYCCHLYGSQAWCFADKSVGNMTTVWNKAVRKFGSFLIIHIEFCYVA